MDKSVKPLLGIGTLIVALIGARLLILNAHRPDDPKLIRQALADAIQASREGRPGGVVELFSQNLKLNDVNVGEDQRKIAQFIREQKPEVVVSNLNPTIIGDEARIVSPIEIDLGLFGKRNLKEVTMIFKKEDSTEYLVIPTRKWRLVEVRAPESAVAELTTG